MKITPDNFYLNISDIVLAHKFVLDEKNRCDYSGGRRLYGLSFAVGGGAVYRFASGKRFTVNRGDVVFLPPDSAYTLTPIGEYYHYTVNFTVDGERSVIPFPKDELCAVRAKNEKYYLNSFHTLCELWGKRVFGYKMRLTSLLYEMLVEFAKETLRDELDSSSYRRIKPAKDYIDSDCTAEASIDFLASLCDMSRTNFRRAFLQEIGETPLRYRDRRLVSLAKELLSTGFFSVCECAERLGFTDASYFGRFFKKHTGMSPGEYKERN